MLHMEELLQHPPGTFSTRLSSRVRGWIAYAAAWVVAAGVWAMASAFSARMSPLQTLPYGLLIMSVAGVMGVAIWRITGRVHWRRGRSSFFGVHALALSVYALGYAVSLVIPDLARGNLSAAITGLNTPVLPWSILMGSWLYLMVAGISYAIRTERERERQAAAAAEARLLAQRAQLSALRAQLNPHFLFNALHTISALVTHDPAAADRALDRLGDLLRYAMADEEMVPLAAEWAFLRDYLAFEQLRLGDRLQIIDRLDPSAADAMLPALILQPLVENAVRHGVSRRAGGGTVRAEAAIEGRMLVVRVSDDGAGSATEDTRGEGLGLGSVRRRVSAKYGDAGALLIDRSPDGFAVTLRIPAE